MCRLRALGIPDDGPSAWPPAQLGRTLIDPIRMLAQWAEVNGDAILDAQDRS
jgi:hypothetical protein